ncbi:MAG: type VI secretion system baseplate subunit TssF [Betaproteobacteria bacterium]
MDPRLLTYYNQELRYLREMGGEFAREFPKIAARLGMEGLEVADPYVERLLEGSAFLAARVQLKLDAEFPQLAQRLLEMVYPNFLAPVPSMTVVQFVPAEDPGLVRGPTIPRGRTLLAAPTALTDTRCEFRTAQPVTLTPLKVVAAECFLSAADLSLSSLALRERPRGGVRVRLQLPAGVPFSALPLDSLRLYLAGLPDVALRLHELMLSACIGVLAGPPGLGGERRLLPPEVVRPVGYADEEAMLPVTHRGLAGTRLLQEYFAFPQRFLFLDVERLQSVFAGCQRSEFELVFLFSRPTSGLEGVVEPANFALHCAPAINLFERRADRAELDDDRSEFHVVPLRTAPLDYEVFDLTRVTAYGDDGSEIEFQPLFAAPQGAAAGTTAFYSTLREPRLVSLRDRRDGPRSGYVGTEVFVSLVDPNEAPYPQAVNQLGIVARCTNRDLPVFVPVGGAAGDFTLEEGAPMQSIRALAGPSRPHSALREGPIAWRLLNLLSLNYLSLLDSGPEEGAQMLRELVGLFAHTADAGLRRQVEGLRNVSVKPVVRRHPMPGPIAFGRGLEIGLTVDELAFEGGSAFLFGAALHHYLSRHVSMNSFVQTALVSLTRGEIMRWAPLGGSRPVA